MNTKITIVAIVAVLGIVTTGYVAARIVGDQAPAQTGSNATTTPPVTIENTDGSTQTFTGVEEMLALIKDGKDVVCQFSQSMPDREQSLDGTFYHKNDGRFRITTTVTDGDIQYEAYLIYDTTAIFTWSDRPDILPDNREPVGAGEGISFYDMTVEDLDEQTALNVNADYRCQARSFDTALFKPPDRFFADW